MIHRLRFFLTVLPSMVLVAVLLVWAGPPARFSSEIIEVTVYPSMVVIEGTYRYQNHNPFPVVQDLSVPAPDFPGAGPALEPEAAIVEPSEKPLGVTRLLGLERFRVPIPPEEEVAVKVRYAQRASAGQAVYLLRTTAPWNRPLENGEYRLKCALGVELVSSNYPLSLQPDGSLGFLKSGFMPAEDWRFSWKANQ